MDCAYCPFQAFAHKKKKAVGEMCTMCSGSFNSGLQTRAAQASLLSNEKLFLMRLLTTRGALVSTTEKAKQVLH